jgi:hypothetical protein
MASYLDNLIAARDAILAGITAQGGYGSYSLDGESWSGTGAEGLQTLQDLIIREQNRVSGRREMRIVRGRRPYVWYR